MPVFTENFNTILFFFQNNSFFQNNKGFFFQNNKGFFFQNNKGFFFQNNKVFLKEIDKKNSFDHSLVIHAYFFNLFCDQISLLPRGHMTIRFISLQFPPLFQIYFPNNVPIITNKFIWRVVTRIYEPNNFLFFSFFFYSFLIRIFPFVLSHLFFINFFFQF